MNSRCKRGIFVIFLFFLSLGTGVFSFSYGIENTKVTNGDNFDFIENVDSESIDLAVDTLDFLEEIKESRKEAVEVNKKPTQSKNIDMSKDMNNMVYYMMSKNGQLSKANAQKIYTSVMKYSKAYGVDSSIIFAIMEQESNFTANCSYQGAYGLMQIYYTTFPYLGITMDEVYDIDKNIHAGVKEFAANMSRYGNPTIALTAYNWGSGNVSRGNYNTKYANRVLSRRNTIKNATHR